MKYQYPVDLPICGLYCFVDSHAKPVPLQNVSVTAQVLDMGCQVEISQVYNNTEVNPIEAVYKFPIDEQAAVCGFEAIIDGKRVVGTVKEKEEAFRTYDKAISEGNGAYLVDEDRADLFTMSVGNLPPNKQVTIKITYLTQLVLEGDKLRFVLPTAVAPRYHTSSGTSNTSGLPQDLEHATYNTHAANNAYGLNLNVGFAMGGRITSVMSPTHAVSVEMPAEGRAVVELASPAVALDQDFVLLVGVADVHEPKVHYEEDRVGHRCAALSLIPDFDLDEETPSDVVFVVDCSGSMSGSKIEQCRNALQLFLRSLPECVKFNIVRFGSSSDSLFRTSQQYSDKTMQKASTWVNKYIHANMGGTEILTPLKNIYKSAPSQSHPRQIFLLTDGQVSNTDAVISLVGENAHSTRVFTFGIGHGASTALVNGCARAGRGVCEMITGAERIEPKVMRQLKRALQPSLTNVSVEWTRESSNGTVAVQIDQCPSHLPPVFQGDRLRVYGYVNDDEHEMPDTCILRATVGGQESIFTVPITADNKRDSEVLHKMAARELIRELEEGPAIQRPKGSLQRRRRTATPHADDKEAIKKRIIELACKYQLMSRHTSFVAVEHRDGAEKEHRPMELRDVPVPRPRQQQQQMHMMRCAAAPAAATNMLCKSAAPLKKKKSKGGGLFGGLSNLFGGSSNKKKEAKLDTAVFERSRARRSSGFATSSSLSASGYAAPAAPAGGACPPPAPPPAMNCAPQMLMADGFGFADCAAPVPMAYDALDDDMSDDECEMEAEKVELADNLFSGMRMKKDMVAPKNRNASIPSRPDAVVQLQLASGAWDATDALFSALNVSKAAFDALCTKANVSAQVVATALAITYLEQYHKATRDEWDMLATKARRWLKKQQSPEILFPECTAVLAA